MYYNNKKLALSIFWFLLGLVLVGLSRTDTQDASLYGAMGIAMCVIAVLQIIRNIRYRKDPAYHEKIDVQAEDERNRFIRMKSWAYAGYIVVLIEAVASVIVRLMGHPEIQQVLMYSVCLIMVVYWVTYMVLSRKY